MPSEKKIKELVQYWIESSREDLKTMRALYDSGRYAFCLFMGHLILEKALKANICKVTGKQAARTHNLPYLAKLAELELTEGEITLLEDADTFNTRARYPDEKFNFSKKCTKSFTDRYYDPIISLYKQLCQKANSKK